MGLSHILGFVSHAPRIPLSYTLADFKQNPTHYQTQDNPDLRKRFAMDIIENIRYEKEIGNHGGSLALHHITVSGRRARTSSDIIYDPMVHKDYIEGYKDFFTDLYSGNEPLDDVNYVDIKSYMQELKTMDQLLLLLRHPYFQCMAEALRFIPSALRALEGLRGKKFPLQRTGIGQETPDQATMEHSIHDWQDVYKIVCCKEEVNISKSIDNLASKDYKDGFTSLYHVKKNNGAPYVDTDGIDELKFYANACEYLHRFVKRSDDEKYQALREVFPYVPIKMFKFFWIYAGYHDGRINLEFVRQLRRLFILTTGATTYRRDELEGQLATSIKLDSYEIKLK